MPEPIHLALDEDAFRKLVSGQVVNLRTADGQEANIILSDIGWKSMLDALLNARLDAALNPYSGLKT